MTVKLIATDMDGTFLDDQKQYDHNYFDRLYTEMLRQHIQFVVASGNQYEQLASFFSDYPDIIYVAENGAYLRTTQQVFNYSSFTPSQVKAILAILTRISEIDLLVAGKKSAYVLKSATPSFIDISQLYYHQLTVIDQYDEINDDVFKFGISCPLDRTEEFVQRFHDALGSLGTPTSSGHGDIDIIQPGIHKANGLKHVGELLTLDLSEMVAFGDGGNDLEMLQEVGLGVAMANAPLNIQKAANDLTGTNNEQGVLTYIDRLLHAN